MSSGGVALDALSSSYRGLVQHVHKQSSTESSSLQSINERVLSAVNNEIGETVAKIHQVAKDGFEQSHQVAEETRELPSLLSQRLSDMPNILGLDSLTSVADDIKRLLSMFQEVTENPNSIFPRLACGDIPVDPGKITSLAKKYAKMDEAQRSMPEAPKSGEEVVRSVVVLLEANAEKVFSAVRGLKDIREQLDQVKEKSRDIQGLGEPVDAVAEEENVIKDLMDKLSELFDPKDISTGERSLKVEQELNPMTMVKSAISFVDQMQDTSRDLDTNVGRMEGLGDVFSSIVNTLRDFFANASQRISGFIENIKLMVESLPKIAGELREFFLPSGLKACLLVPSNVLVNITDTIESLRSKLSEPEAKARSAVSALQEGAFASKIEALKQKVAELVTLPRKLIEMVRNQELSTSIPEALRRVIAEMLSEIGASAIGGAVENVLEAVGQGDLVDDMKERLDDFVRGDSKGDSKDDDGNWVQDGAGKLLNNFISKPWN